jgi:hypothetical protein
MMKSKRPEEWTAEEKLKAIVEHEKLDEQQKGKYLREKGLHTSWLLTGADQSHPGTANPKSMWPLGRITRRSSFISSDGKECRLDRVN